jgi:hypothetical protein
MEFINYKINKYNTQENIDKIHKWQIIKKQFGGGVGIIPDRLSVFVYNIGNRLDKPELDWLEEFPV